MKPVAYSVSLKYVFIHIPKCAGTSIHRALSSLHDSLSVPTGTRLYHKHSKACEVRRILGPAWNQAFKFAFVRNPWDLMVSSYHWWLTGARQFPSLLPHTSKIRQMAGFPVFIRSAYGLEMINEQHGRDLLDWLCDDDKLIVDFVGKYETLEDDWRHICSELGVVPITLTRENRVLRDPYQLFYDETSRRLVADRFARTIERFGYEF